MRWYPKAQVLVIEHLLFFYAATIVNKNIQKCFDGADVIKNWTAYSMRHK